MGRVGQPPETDASRVAVADGRDADLIQIGFEPAVFKLFCEREPLHGVLHPGLILSGESADVNCGGRIIASWLT
jgi:hypothetical protein